MNKQLSIQQRLAIATVLGCLIGIIAYDTFGCNKLVAFISGLIMGIISNLATQILFPQKEAYGIFTYNKDYNFIKLFYRRKDEQLHEHASKLQFGSSVPTTVNKQKLNVF